LDSTSIEFRELNEFLDKKNLDELKFFLIDTKLISLKIFEKIIQEQVPHIYKNAFEKVNFFFNFWLI
jgi:hypothetical protein